MDRCQAPSAAWNERSNQRNEERTDERPRREEEPLSRRTPAGQTLEQPLRHSLRWQQPPLREKAG